MWVWMQVSLCVCVFRLQRLVQASVLPFVLLPVCFPCRALPCGGAEWGCPKDSYIQPRAPRMDLIEERVSADAIKAMILDYPGGP